MALHKPFIWIGPGVLQLDHQDKHEVIAEGKIVKDKLSLSQDRVDHFIKLKLAVPHKVDGEGQIAADLPRTELTPEQIVEAQLEAEANFQATENMRKLARPDEGTAK